MLNWLLLSFAMQIVLMTAFFECQGRRKQVQIAIRRVAVLIQ